MKHLALGSYALVPCAVAAMLAGCGESQPPHGAPGGVQQATSSYQYRVIYNFGGYKKDGTFPEAALIDVSGILYGTTSDGGGNACRGSTGNKFFICGALFSVTTGGAEKVLHHFGKGTDGYHPRAGLIDVGGTLYGTTFYGGTINAGIVFSITTEGKEKVLHSFGGSGDGAYPIAGLLNVNGTLYGTTVGGGQAGSQCDGARGCGIVFSISTAGSEKVLYRFKGSPNDGGQPWANLIDVGGTLYGTTSAGGSYGGGTAFSLSTTGKEHVLHSFGNGKDGYQPLAGLLDVKGVLYGTTASGGSGVKNRIHGTVFSITTGGKEKVLHTFCLTGSTDGCNPFAGLINVNGTLYGATNAGGSDDDGTVFSITTTGQERVLHSFGGRPDDGGGPQASLIDVNGTLYGTTWAGGAYGTSARNYGTVFALKP